nr:hypothetical protein [Halospeciosus flavus]
MVHPVAEREAELAVVERDQCGVEGRSVLVALVGDRPVGRFDQSQLAEFGEAPVDGRLGDTALGRQLGDRRALRVRRPQNLPTGLVTERVQYLGGVGESASVDVSAPPARPGCEGIFEIVYEID